MMAKNVLTSDFSQARNGIATANVEIDPGDGNLIVDGLVGGEQVLASGTLQYLDSRGLPEPALSVSDGEANLNLSGHIRQSWFRFPWSACNAATVWQIHLNPAVSWDIAARSAGGNIKLDLAGAAVTSVSAGTGGGNIEMDLSGNAAIRSVVAKSGAGNVILSIPSHMAARILATSGLGKVVVDPRFAKVDKGIYQSADYESTATRIEIIAQTGAGNVTVGTRDNLGSDLVGSASRGRADAS